tara:strand:- start:617 stop:2401 length:1785 start_codon:yes stop_codon:yes gene_type:complete
MDKTHLKSLTSKPGIYKMLDKHRNIIYVGKASNLRNRVNSYFSSTNNSIKTSKLVEKICDIDLIITKNEQDALILENNLIKKHKPKYNILLRDDKSYPYIFIDTKHTYPSIKFYRGNQNRIGKYFGPYTSVNTLRYMLNLIQKIFKIRQCEDSFFKNRKKPCLQYQIKRCSAPCVDYINQSNYENSINEAILLMTGKDESMLKKLSINMNQLSEDKKYEDAATVRDKIAMIRRFTQNKNVLLDRDNIDILTISSKENKTCIDVFMIRNGLNMGNKTFSFTIHDNSDDVYILNSFLKQYYLKNTPPDKIISKIKIIDKSLLKKLFYKNYKKHVDIICSIRGLYKELFYTCQENTDNRLNRLLKSKSNLFSTVIKDLSIDKIINNVICFDISHSSGRQTVGSSIWFDNNGPVKKYYRKYNLDSVKSSDDYGAIQNIISRRLSKLKQENNLPDLLIVDGGKGHVKQANQVLQDLSIKNILTFGIVKGDRRLTKNDRIIDSQYIDITKKISKKTLITFQILRDEAHRFAIVAQRKRLQSKQFNSKLDDIPGIGKTRKIEILRHFGGIDGVIKSSIDELKKVHGISNKMAKIIYNYLHK